MTIVRYPRHAWRALPWAANWSALAGVRGGEYCIDAPNLVRIRGAAQCAATVTLGMNIAILPIGFRPAFNEWFSVEASFGAGNRAAFLLTIDTIGQIEIFDFQGNAPNPTPAYVTFGSIAFQRGG